MDYDVRIIGDPVLRRKAETVTVFDEELKALAQDMLETMVDSDGVGLAAPQVGISKRLLVVGIPDEEDKLHFAAFVNPRILEQRGNVVMEEGCLSVPGIREDVERPESIRLSWQDLDGEQYEGWLTDLDARVLQHEMDHLEGVLFIDRISPARRTTLKSRLNDLKRQD